MICSHCGQYVDDNSKFCPSCGAPVGAAQQPAQEVEVISTPVSHTTYQTNCDVSPSVSATTALELFFRNFSDFNGRSRRSEYWWVMLFQMIVSAAISRICGEDSIVTTLWSLAILIPTLSLTVRRLHDIGKSGWNILWNICPLVGQIILLVYFVRDSEAANQYGDSPKY